MKDALIKTLIAVPYQIVLNGIERVLSDLGGFQISLATDCDTAYTLMKANKYDLLITDPMIVLGGKRSTMDDFFAMAKDSTLLGVRSSLLPEDVFKRFSDVIDLADTKSAITAKLNRIVNTEDEQPSSDDCELSAREKEVLVAIAKGMLNKEIADHLHISIHTVMSHRKNIQQKTNIKTASGLTIYAIVNNLISPQELGAIE